MVPIGAADIHQPIPLICLVNQETCGMWPSACSSSCPAVSYTSGGQGRGTQRTIWTGPGNSKRHFTADEAGALCATVRMHYAHHPAHYAHRPAASGPSHHPESDLLSLISGGYVLLLCCPSGVTRNNPPLYMHSGCPRDPVNGVKGVRTPDPLTVSGRAPDTRDAPHRTRRRNPKRADAAKPVNRQHISM